MNRVYLMGRLTADPNISKMPNGTDKCSLRIAVNRFWKEKKETCYVDVVVWSRQGVNCEKHLSKGSKVLVEGRLDFEEWSKDGEPRSKHLVTAETVHFTDWNTA